MVYELCYLVNHTMKYIAKHNGCQIDIKDKLEVIKCNSTSNLIKLKNLIDYEYYYCDSPDFMYFI